MTVCCSSVLPTPVAVIEFHATDELRHVRYGALYGHVSNSVTPGEMLGEIGFVQCT